MRPGVSLLRGTGGAAGATAAIGASGRPTTSSSIGTTGVFGRADGIGAQAVGGATGFGRAGAGAFATTGVLAGLARVEPPGKRGPDDSAAARAAAFGDFGRGGALAGLPRNAAPGDFGRAAPVAGFERAPAPGVFDRAPAPGDFGGLFFMGETPSRHWPH